MRIILITPLGHHVQVVGSCCHKPNTEESMRIPPKVPPSASLTLISCFTIIFVISGQNVVSVFKAGLQSLVFLLYGADVLRFSRYRRTLIFVIRTEQEVYLLMTHTHTRTRTRAHLPLTQHKLI